MTAVQVFSYVAYTFGAVFLIGALFLLFTIFRKTETDEQKANKKAAKVAAKTITDDPIASTSFFANRQNAQLDLHENVDAGDINASKPSRPDNNDRDEPAPVFNKPTFVNNDVNLKSPAKENSKFNLPF